MSDQNTQPQVVAVVAIGEDGKFYLDWFKGYKDGKVLPEHMEGVNIVSMLNIAGLNMAKTKDKYMELLKREREAAEAKAAAEPIDNADTE